MRKLDAKFFSNVKVRKDNPNSHSEDRPLILSEAVLSGEKTISEVGVMNTRSLTNRVGKNFLEIMGLYKDRCIDLSNINLIQSHFHCHIKINDNYVISVVQEHFNDGVTDLEYGILYRGELIYLDEFGDSVARYQTLEQVIEVIEKSISE